VDRAGVTARLATRALSARALRVSPEFADLWARHDVAEHTSAVKAVDHPEAGTLIFESGATTGKLVLQVATP
jgi:hypothetical protein